MGSKRRTDLTILQSEAKTLKEHAFDIKTCRALPKSVKNNEKPICEPNFCLDGLLFNGKKSKVAYRAKRTLPKFRATRSNVRVAKGRSNFVVLVWPVFWSAGVVAMVWRPLVVVVVLILVVVVGIIFVIGMASLS